MSNIHYHIFLSAIIAYVLLHVFDGWKKPLIITMLLGLGKEVYDWDNGNYIDCIDLLADFIGFLIGYIIRKI